MLSDAHSTRAGVEPRSPDQAVWRVAWTAPEDGPVRIHHAANSANGGDSRFFGDLVYATEVTLDRFR